MDLVILIHATRCSVLNQFTAASSFVRIYVGICMFYQTPFRKLEGFSSHWKNANVIPSVSLAMACEQRTSMITEIIKLFSSHAINLMKFIIFSQFEIV